MDPESMTRMIKETLDGVDVLIADDNAFFYYDPDGSIPPNRRMPFATLITNDLYDRASNLSRPGVFRLNIGVSKETYRTLFGAPPRPPGADGVVDTGHDFTVLDQFLPHPIYAPQSWISVLNPGDALLPRVQELLAEAHRIVADRYSKRQSKEEA